MLAWLLPSTAALAQGRGGQIWTTASGDAARTASVRSDPRISKGTLSAPGFQLLWKRQLEARAGLTQPVFSAPGFITYKGFKGVAYLGSASDTFYAIDYDLNRMFWTRKLSDAAPSTTSAAPCANLLPAVTETAALPASAETGRGAAPAGRARGGAGGAIGGPGRSGAVPALYVVSSAGMLHSLNLQDGSDWFPPAKLLPAPNAKIAGSILANGVMYVATAGNCGGVPNGVYAMDLTPATAQLASSGRGGLPTVPIAVPASTDVARWETHGGSIVGSGPALGPDGTVYVATADGEVVALEPKTLAQKAYFTPGKNAFTSSPVVFSLGEKDLVAAASADARIYILDASSIGGADHKTPLGQSAPLASAAAALSTFEDASGARWILAASPQEIAALKVVSSNGAVELQPQWRSPIAASSQPTYVNGVVFAIASGNRLVALDSGSGKEIWNSGAAIASPVRDIGPAVDDSQVYVVTTDGTLYTFGFQVER